MAKKKKKERKSIDELTKGYEDFIKGKETNANGRELFEKTIKKAATVKQHSAK